jgi:EmrB/QacA subfamily drug resistance transporter
VRRYIIFASVVITLLMCAISSTTVAVAFPQIISSFNTSLVIAGWVLGANNLAGTIGMPLAGKVCDAYGSKFAFILFIILFTLGALLSAIAPNMILLIIFRLIQGLGMGGVLPAGTAIVANEFKDSRQQSIGLMSAVFAIGPIIGPNLGGWLTTAFGWESTFWIFVPFGVLALIVTLILIPRTKGDSSRLDYLGAGLLAGCVAAVMFGISLMDSENGAVSWPLVALFFALSIIFGFVFIRRLSRTKNPIIDVVVLRDKRFMAANLYNVILGFAMFALVSFVPLYAVSIFKMSTFDSGFVMTPRSIGVGIASIVASLSLMRWGYRKPMITGTLLTAASVLAMALITPDTISGWPVSGFIMLSLILLVNGVGQGIANPAANNACIDLMPEKIGTITGVRGMFRFIGAAVGTNLAALVIEGGKDIQHGFFLVLVGTAVILLLSIPLIYMIPKNAAVSLKK